jgi:hypothetical protein
MTIPTRTLPDDPTAVLLPAATEPARRRRPGRALFVGAGIVLAVVTVGYGCLVLVNLLGRRTYRSTQRFPLTHVVQLQGGDDQLTIVPDAVDHVVVQQTVRRGIQHTRGVNRVDAAGVLHLGVRCPKWVPTFCDITTTVHVPADLDVRGSLGDGSVTASGLHGSFHVSTGDGSIHLDRQVGDVWLASGDGTVRLTELRARHVAVSTGDGSVSIDLAAPPDSVVLHSGDGTVSLAVPDDGTPYAVTTSTGDGSVHNDLANDPRASRRIDVHTGDGSVHLSYG